MQKLYNCAVWLSPENEEQRLVLESCISSLSTRFNSSVFVPHMTFLSGKTNDLNKLSNLANEIAEQILPLELDIKDLAYSDDFFKTFYIEFKSNAQFENKLSIAKDFFESKGQKLSIPTFPHLSLLYANINQEEKAKLKQQTSFDFKAIKFNKISIAYPSQNKWKEIESWKIL